MCERRLGRELTRGAVYWNFKSKAQLFLALLDDRIDKPVGELMRLAETAPADQPTAASIGQGLARLIAERAPLIMLLFEHWAAAVRDPALADALNKRQERLRIAVAHTLEARHKTTGIPLTFPADRLATAVPALAHPLPMSKLIDP